MKKVVESTISKSEFSALVGLAKSRISQLVRLGLPVVAHGRIPVLAGVRWYEDAIKRRLEKARAAGLHIAKQHGERSDSTLPLTADSVRRRQAALAALTELELESQRRQLNLSIDFSAF